MNGIYIYVRHPRLILNRLYNSNNMKTKNGKEQIIRILLCFRLFELTRVISFYRAKAERKRNNIYYN